MAGGGANKNSSDSSNSNNNNNTSTTTAKTEDKAAALSKDMINVVVLPSSDYVLKGVKNPLYQKR